MLTAKWIPSLQCNGRKGIVKLLDTKWQYTILYDLGYMGKGASRKYSGKIDDKVSPGITLPKPVLSRARQLNEEYVKLKRQQAEQFDARTAKRLGQLAPTVKLLQRWEELNETVKSLHDIMVGPCAELRQLALEEANTLETELKVCSEDLTDSIIPKHAWDCLPCLIEIRPGVGGLEASLFAGELVRMYQAYCIKYSLDARIIKLEECNMGGVDNGESVNGSSSCIQEAIIRVNSGGSYAMLKCEAGVHRVQRVPETETKGRTHTSCATVVILPLLEDTGVEAQRSDVNIDERNVKCEVMRARGAGGQHVNRTESAVRLTHIPTGISVSMQDSRSQHRNRALAWQILRARVAEREEANRKAEKEILRQNVLKNSLSQTLSASQANRSNEISTSMTPSLGSRSAKIRTYNWSAQRVTDHRIGSAYTMPLTDVLNGGASLNSLMKACRQMYKQAQIDEMNETGDMGDRD